MSIRHYRLDRVRSATSGAPRGHSGSSTQTKQSGRGDPLRIERLDGIKAVRARSKGSGTDSDFGPDAFPPFFWSRCPFSGPADARSLTPLTPVEGYLSRAMPTGRHVRLAIPFVPSPIAWMTGPRREPNRPATDHSLVAWRVAALQNDWRVVRQFRPSGSSVTGSRSCRSPTHPITTSASRS